MNGEYIDERFLPTIIRTICHERGIRFESFSEEWLLRLEKSSQVEWIVGYQFGINNASGSQIAADKVAAYTVLAHSNIPAVPHHLIKSVSDAQARLRSDQPLPEEAAYLLKPLKGTSGKNISRYETLSAAIVAANASPEKELALSPLLDIVHEWRLIMLDGELLLAFTKSNPVQVNGIPMFNLSHGAIPTTFTPEHSVIRIAAVAAQECNLRLGAIDFVQLRSGEVLLLELNSGFAVERYARVSEENRATAATMYDRIIRTMFDIA